MPGAGEAGQFVDVAAGLIEIHALAQPDHPGDAEIAAQLLLDVRARELGVAVRIEQAFFGGQAGALAVHMNGAALEHEGGPVSVRALDFQYLLRHLLVAVPGEVQTAAKAAPGIEGPIHAAAPAFGIDDESRPAVAYPCIVAGDFDDAHRARQAGPRILELRGRDTHGHRLAARDGGRDGCKHRLRRFGAAAPIIRALRPQHPAARMPFELRGHAEAILRRG